jgi:DNA mismatch endonuclease (patch repair protein)
MTDVLTAEQRRLNMSRIRGRDTKPEMLIRKGLHSRGLRYRLYARDLPGRPDLVFPRFRAVIFVHGCFWHGHDCPLFKLPLTRQAFWEKKIAQNRLRDASNHAALRASGWRVLTVWECCLRGPARKQQDLVLGACSTFLKSDIDAMSVMGDWSKA